MTYQAHFGRVDIAVLDFSKAFDTVPHNRLLTKLKHYGIAGNTLPWIREFLTNRTQRVLIHDSRLVSVRSGVPQGTVLGPLLLLAFINDLPHHVQSQIRLFADDCLLYRPICDVSDSVALQRALSSLESWSEASILRSAMSYQPFFYQLDGCILKHVSNHPYIGVELSECLTFSVHIANTFYRQFCMPEAWLPAAKLKTLST